MIKILFVCAGNICRSPTAEAIARDLIEKNNWTQKFSCASAGTHAHFVGNPSDPYALSTARAHGIDMGDIRSAKVTPYDFEAYDYLIAMDTANLNALKSRAAPSEQGKIHLLLSFIPNCYTKDVPDPYQGGADGFETVYQLVYDGVEALLNHLAQS